MELISQLARDAQYFKDAIRYLSVRVILVQQFIIWFSDLLIYGLFYTELLFCYYQLGPVKLFNLKNMMS